MIDAFITSASSGLRFFAIIITSIFFIPKSSSLSKRRRRLYVKVIDCLLSPMYFISTARSEPFGVLKSPSRIIDLPEGNEILACGVYESEKLEIKTACILF